MKDRRASARPIFLRDRIWCALGLGDRDGTAATMGGLVWLASYPKSGNTWLRAFLHNLLRDEDEPVDINAFMQLSVGDTLREWYSEVAGGDIDELSDDDIAQLRPQVHRRLTEISKNSVFVKTHNYLGTDRGVPLITMAVTVGAIYVVRNPLDLVLSLAPHFGLSIDGAIKLMASEKAVHRPIGPTSPSDFPRGRHT